MTWEPTDVAFERVTIPADRNTRIAGLLAMPTDRESRGLVVLPPGYERRIHHYAALSYVFVKHGYATLRFDLRNHVGFSDGEVADFTLSSLADDIAAVLQYSQQQDSTEPHYLVAPSLAARAATRALARGATATGLIVLMPVVDMRYTLAQVSGEDLVLKWEMGGETDASRLYLISKNEVKAAFGQDAVEQDWGGVSQAQADIIVIECPIFVVAAEQDEWVKAKDVTVAFSGASDWPRECTIIEATSHDIARNLPVMRLLLKLTVQGVNGLAGIDEIPQIPDFKDLVDVITTERRWAKEQYSSMPIEVGAET